MAKAVPIKIILDITARHYEGSSSVGRAPALLPFAISKEGSYKNCKPADAGSNPVFLHTN